MAANTNFVSFPLSETETETGTLINIMSELSAE